MAPSATAAATGTVPATATATAAASAAAAVDDEDDLDVAALVALVAPALEGLVDANDEAGTETAAALAAPPLAYPPRYYGRQRRPGVWEARKLAGASAAADADAMDMGSGRSSVSVMRVDSSDEWMSTSTVSWSGASDMEADEEDDDEDLEGSETEADDASWRVNAAHFYTSVRFEVDLPYYVRRLATYLPLGRSVALTASVLMRRAGEAHPSLAVNCWSVVRLLLTALIISFKVVDDAGGPGWEAACSVRGGRGGRPRLSAPTAAAAAAAGCGAPSPPLLGVLGGVARIGCVAASELVATEAALLRVLGWQVSVTAAEMDAEERRLRALGQSREGGGGTPVWYVAQRGEAAVWM